jgi:WD40 repeat protein
MISAGGDGTIATWDFRTLSGSNAKEAAPMDETSSANKTFESKEQHVMAIRTPIATMTHAAESKRVCQSAAVMLSRGVTQPNTVLSTGVDAIVREWEISTGKLVAQDSTKHCDGISGFATFSDMQSSLSASSAEAGGEGISKYGGIITSSWDGTVRMRKFVRK